VPDLLEQRARTDHKVILRISGMTCGSCVAHVEKALRAVGGVRDAAVNLATETAVVTLADPGLDTRELTAAVQRAGYEAYAMQPAASFAGAADAGLARPRRGRTRRGERAMLIAFALGLPVIAIHAFARHLPGAHPQAAAWPGVLQAILVAVMLASPAGAPILAGGVRAAWHRAPNMDVLIGLGVSAAFVGSLVAMISEVLSRGRFYETHFEMAAMILIFIDAGRYLEGRARGQASSALRALAARAPRIATLVRGNEIVVVPLAEVKVGDVLRVNADEYVPADGRVVAGEAAVDQSMLTGESVPVEVGPGAAVFGGTRVTSGSITIAAEAIGAESAVARIAQLVDQAQSSRTRLQRIADRAAGVFVPVVVLLATITFAGWAVAGIAGVGIAADRAHWLAEAFSRAIAVLVVACPCAMGLATPTAVMVATGNAALRGILVRDAAALEASALADVILFDKTGTLTTGRPVVVQVVGEVGGVEPRELLAFAASAEQFSRHPLARAIVAKAREWGVAVTVPDEYEQKTGLGVSASVQGRRILVGSSGFLARNHVDCGEARERLERLARDGRTVVLVAVDGRLGGLIAVADQPRPTAIAAIGELQRLGCDVVMVTGDDRHTAAAIAAEIGVRSVRAELAPDGKLAVVREFQAANRRVAFVGDGINDAPALAAADAGIAFAAGAELASETAGITLIGDDLTLIPAAVLLARRSVRIIRQNLFWAFFYNAAMIPLAAFGVVPASLAAAAMMLSSISVVLNSLRLQRGKT